LLKVAIASGKGGTGKTTVATNLAWLAGRRGHSVAYLDCDVEEPNGHIFLKPAFTGRQVFRLPVPQVDEARCDGCGRCGRFCRFNAIAVMGGQVLVYPELCHACGGCALVCPRGAIREQPRRMGLVEVGTAGPVRFVRGTLDVGQAMSSPLIGAVKSAAPQAGLVILDCPPGTSCPVIECVRGSDLLVLVTEPTPFGLHDLKLAVAMAGALKARLAVVINRCDAGDDRTRQYCRRHGLPVLAAIPHDQDIARAYSQGKVACTAVPFLEPIMENLLEAILAAGAVEA